MIFYGDEAGMWGANDPDCRKPMVWADKNYDAETFNPDQSKHEPDEVAFNVDLFNWYKKIIALRTKYTSIRLGSYTTLVTNDEQQLYAFSRSHGKEEVIVIINRGHKPVSFTHPALKKKTFRNAFTKSVVKDVKVNGMEMMVCYSK